MYLKRHSEVVFFTQGTEQERGNHDIRELKKTPHKFKAMENSDWVFGEC